MPKRLRPPNQPFRSRRASKVYTPRAVDKIENNLAAVRQTRNLPVSALAATAGISRQTMYAIEAGTYAPNTAVALRLARALEVSVEDLFSLPDSAAAPDFPEELAALLPGADPPEPGQPIQLCRVDDHLVASVPSPVRWYLPAYDAIVTGKAAHGRKTKVQIYHPDGDFRNRLLIAGCDPGISVLARHMHSAGVELVLVHRNSSQALALLQRGLVHIAGTHLRDEVSGESNIPTVGRMFPKNSVTIYALAVWEEGMVTARGNPKRIHAIEDLVRKDVRIVNREPGSGSRLLLDGSLGRLRLDPAMVAGYDRLTSGHLAAAWQVQDGAADCCIATRAAARLFGLHFIPLARERYDLVLRREHLELSSVQTLLDKLKETGFRREMERVGGYDTKVAGQRIL